MIHYLRIKTANSMLRIVAWLMGLPSPTLDSGLPSMQEDAAPPGSERYFVAYTFSCAWPHHNSPLRVPGGFGDSVIMIDGSMDADRVQSIRSHCQNLLSRNGQRSPFVTILCLTKIT